MTVTTHPVYRSTPGPLHGILLAGTVPLFLGGLLSDIAYYQSYQIQWANFAAWLIAGGLLFCGLALVFALVNLIRAPQKSGRPVMYFVVLLITWVLGLINAFEHAKDAWAAMPSGLVLSVIVTVLAIVAAWIGLSNLSNQRTGGAE
ncbi:membrane protein [Paucimonas lemoignei]|nr:membrane protein [Paucimonas lemoignei]